MMWRRICKSLFAGVAFMAAAGQAAAGSGLAADLRSSKTMRQTRLITNKVRASVPASIFVFPSPLSISWIAIL